MNDDDLRAGPRTAPTPAPAIRSARRRIWPWFLLLAVLGLAAIVSTAWHGVMELDAMPVHITIDGEEVVHGIDLASMPPAHKVVLVGTLVFALLAAAVVVPVALLTVLAGAIVVAVTAIGLPLLAVAAVLAILLSPLLLLVWLVWRLLRPSPTIPA